jgi:hypothetical protein
MSELAIGIGTLHFVQGKQVPLRPPKKDTPLTIRTNPVENKNRK